MVSFLAAHASGKTLTAIALEMHYSFSNVRNTLDAAKERLGTKSLVHAVVIAQSMGYLTQATGAEYRVFPIAA